MKIKMTKREVAIAKKDAQKRKNRRLTDGEYSRLMAQASTKLGLVDGEGDLPIVDLTDPSCQTRLLEEQSLISSVNDKSDFVKAKTINSKHEPQRLEARKIHQFPPSECSPDLVKKFAEVIKRAGSSNTYKTGKSNKANKRMSNRQFNALMKKASEELGINDRKGMEILDLDKGSMYNDKVKKITIDDIIDRSIASLWRTCPSIYKDYVILTKGKKLQTKDKLAILTYVAHKVDWKKPFCLLSKEEKTNIVRKVVKPRGDIKERPFRILPNDEYFLEIQNKKRTKFDTFDKLELDKKIEWARYADLILNMGDREILGDIETFKIRVRDPFDAESAIFAMRYACKMAKISEFRGDFSNPYWILLRVFKFHNNMTNKEYNVYYRMALEHLNLLEQKKTIPVIEASEAVKRLVPMMKKTGVYGIYVGSQKKNSHDNLKLAGDLLLRRG